MFTKEIENWRDWGAVYQSIPSFTPLIRGIYIKEGLPFTPLANLSPGTNAVFRSGDTVCKVFAPDSSGVNSEQDYNTELAAMRYAAKAGVPTPKVIASGCAFDRYPFRYLIMEYIQGQDAGPLLPLMNPQEKMRFAKELRDICNKLGSNKPPQGVRELTASDIGNERWSAFSDEFMQSLHKRAELLLREESRYAHGDLTGENVLICADQAIAVIDYADSVIAPACYELPPILIELFLGDAYLAKAFCVPDSSIARELADGIALHDFGGDLMESFLRRHTKLSPSDLRDLDHLFNVFAAHYAN